MLAAGGDVELHFFTAAVNRSLDSAQVWNQGPEFNARNVTDGLEYFVGVRHLRHSPRMHKGANLNYREFSIN